DWAGRGAHPRADGNAAAAPAVRRDLVWAADLPRGGPVDHGRSDPRVRQRLRAPALPGGWQALLGAGPVPELGFGGALRAVQVGLPRWRAGGRRDGPPGAAEHRRVDRRADAVPDYDRTGHRCVVLSGLYGMGALPAGAGT